MKILMIVLASLSFSYISKAEDKEKSCRQEVGKKKAAVYVSQCIQVSPATHPPCNDANPCWMITDEIKRGCEYSKDTVGATVPKFCSKYLGKSK
jgi:hypothetical protein